MKEKGKERTTWKAEIQKRITVKGIAISSIRNR